VTLIRQEAPPGCDNCTAYSSTIKALLADWNDAGCPKRPSDWSRQIGAALAMYLEHLGEHLPT
jgi:hypothetical protein